MATPHDPLACSPAAAAVGAFVASSDGPASQPNVALGGTSVTKVVPGSVGPLPPRDPFAVFSILDARSTPSTPFIKPAALPVAASPAPSLSWSPSPATTGWNNAPRQGWSTLSTVTWSSSLPVAASTSALPSNVVPALDQSPSSSSSSLLCPSPVISAKPTATSSSPSSSHSSSPTSSHSSSSIPGSALSRGRAIAPFSARPSPHVGSATFPQNFMASPPPSFAALSSALPAPSLTSNATLPSRDAGGAAVSAALPPSSSSATSSQSFPPSLPATPLPSARFAMGSMRLPAHVLNASPEYRAGFCSGFEEGFAAAMLSLTNAASNANAPPSSSVPQTPISRANAAVSDALMRQLLRSKGAGITPIDRSNPNLIPSTPTTPFEPNMRRPFGSMAANFTPVASGSDSLESLRVPVTPLGALPHRATLTAGPSASSAVSAHVRRNSEDDGPSIQDQLDDDDASLLTTESIVLMPSLNAKKPAAPLTRGNSSDLLTTDASPRSNASRDSGDNISNAGSNNSRSTAFSHASTETSEQRKKREIKASFAMLQAQALNISALGSGSSAKQSAGASDPCHEPDIPNALTSRLQAMDAANRQRVRPAPAPKLPPPGANAEMSSAGRALAGILATHGHRAAGSTDVDAAELVLERVIPASRSATASPVSSTRPDTVSSPVVVAQASVAAPVSHEKVVAAANSSIRVPTTPSLPSPRARYRNVSFSLSAESSGAPPSQTCEANSSASLAVPKSPATLPNSLPPVSPRIKGCTNLQRLQILLPPSPRVSRGCPASPLSPDSPVSPSEANAKAAAAKLLTKSPRMASYVLPVAMQFMSSPHPALASNETLAPPLTAAQVSEPIGTPIAPIATDTTSSSAVSGSDSQSRDALAPAPAPTPTAASVASLWSSKSQATASTRKLRTLSSFDLH